MAREPIDGERFSILLDEQTERSLTPEEQTAMEEHRHICSACAERALAASDLRAMEADTAVPEAFSAGWRAKIREEEKLSQQTPKKRNWKGILAAAAAAVFLLGGTILTRNDLPGCVVYENGSNGSAFMAAYGASDAVMLGAAPRMAAKSASPMEYAVVEESAAYDAEMPAPANAEAVREEKIIRSASFTVKTAEFEAAMEKLQALTEDCGGRVEYLSRRGDTQNGETRSASLTLRIPAQRLDEFLAGTENVGTVTSLVQESQDVSDSYYDIRTRLETQQYKMERLQKLMLEADRVSDMIEIESAIADTQYYIDSYTAQLSGMDSRVSYSTVEVTVRETRAIGIREAGLGERILSALRNSAEAAVLFLQDMLLFVVSALPWLAGIAAVVLAVRWIIRKRKGRKEK